MCDMMALRCYIDTRATRLPLMFQPDGKAVCDASLAMSAFSQATGIWGTPAAKAREKRGRQHQPPDGNTMVLQERMQADIKDKRVAVSGAGNVAQFAVEKLLHLGAVPVSMSDSQGTLYEPDGISIEQLSQIMSLKSAHKRLCDVTPSSTGAPPMQLTPGQHQLKGPL